VHTSAASDPPDLNRSDPDAPGWRRPPASAADVRRDAALAGVVFASAVMVSVLYRGMGVYAHPANGPVTVAGLAAIALPLAVRRRYPSAVALVVAVAFGVSQALRVPEQVVGNIALFAALYAVGAWEADRRRAAIVRTAVVGGMGLWLMVALYRASVQPVEDLGLDDDLAHGPFSPYVSFALLQIVTNVLFFAGAWWFGDHAYAAAGDRAREALRTEQLRAERARAQAQAVTIERMRLARELHDVVAHHVSLMGVAASAARTQVRTDPQAAAASLEQVESGAREALEELHGLLTTLRDDSSAAGGPTAGAGRGTVSGAGVAVAAAVGLDGLGALVAESEAAGVPTRLVEIGTAAALAPTVQVSLYRIVQEALTNVRKHAGPGARAEVRLRWLADAVEVEVSDDGRGPGRPAAGDAARAGGLGLVGMRERVAAHGGELEVGPRRGGGFLVRARVPRQLAAVRPVDLAGAGR
jgi:signal transduction histidine kinase